MLEWNNRTIPVLALLKFNYPWQLLTMHNYYYICLIHNIGRRGGGMAGHVSNAVMARDNRVQRIIVSLPTPMEAVSIYNRAGGRLSDETPFGEDPLQGDSNKCTIRQQATFPSFEPIFHRLVNSDPSLEVLHRYHRLSRTL